MNGEDRTTKRVFRMMAAWNPEREERWLSDQARAGWHLDHVTPFGYTFVRGAPAEVAYRLDWGPSCRQDRTEYVGLFRDAGWEYMRSRGKWNVFRKPVVDGVVPEIYTDPQSRVRMYYRVMAFLFCLLAVVGAQMGPQIALAQDPAHAGRFPWIPVIYGVLTIPFLYGIVRLALAILRLRRSIPPADAR